MVQKHQRIDVFPVQAPATENSLSLAVEVAGIANSCYLNVDILKSLPSTNEVD